MFAVLCTLYDNIIAFLSIECVENFRLLKGLQSCVEDVAR